MKIVNRKTFLTLPEGTVFSKYEPCIFEDLRIKGDSIDLGPASAGDFGYQSIADAIKCHDSGEFFDLLFIAQEDGASLEMDFDCGSRDGLFEENQLFVVWERQDVEALIVKLQQSLLAYG